MSKDLIALARYVWLLPACVCVCLFEAPFGVPFQAALNSCPSQTVEICFCVLQVPGLPVLWLPAPEASHRCHSVLGAVAFQYAWAWGKKHVPFGYLPHTPCIPSFKKNMWYARPLCALFCCGLKISSVFFSMGLSFFPSKPLQNEYPQKRQTHICSGTHQRKNGRH